MQLWIHALALAPSSAALRVPTPLLVGRTGSGRDETMATYIHMTVLTGNLIDAIAGIDEEASARRYVELLRARLRQAYPDAETDIRLAFATGVAPATRVIVGHEEDAEAARDVDALAAKLRASGEWAVFAS